MLNEPKKAALGTIAEYLPTGTASGAIASFDDGADGVPVKALTVNIAPVQEGSGNPSPDNVRPIKGWTGCTISHSDADTTNPDTLPISWEDEAGTIYGGTLTLNEDGSVDVVSRYVVYDIQPSKWTWMSSSHCFKIDRTALSPRYKTFGSNADNRVVDIISDKYKPNTFNNIANSANDPNYSVAIREYNANWIALRTNGTNAVLPEACQIKLPLATSITRHIDADQLRTLLGTNNIWADTGDVSVTYRRDIGLALAKLEALILENGG